MFMLSKKYQNKFDGNLKNRFFNTYKLSSHDIKLSFLLQKAVYPYKCMGDSKKLNEILVPEKEDFHSHLNMEGITDAG